MISFQCTISGAKCGWCTRVTDKNRNGDNCVVSCRSTVSCNLACSVDGSAEATNKSCLPKGFTYTTVEGSPLVCLATLQDRAGHPMWACTARPSNGGVDAFHRAHVGHTTLQLGTKCVGPRLQPPHSARSPTQGWCAKSLATPRRTWMVPTTADRCAVWCKRYLTYLDYRSLCGAKSRLIGYRI